MTLDTRIYVTAPVDQNELFHACQSVLALYDEHERGPDRQHWSDSAPGYSDGRLLSNEPGQDLPAWLMLHYQPGAMYRPEATGEGDCPCWVEVSLDTAYGYRDNLGRNCGALHAEIVELVGHWLDARGVAWKWRNEFTDEVFDGHDGLDTLGSGAAEAREWFMTRALPAILGGAS